MRKIVENPCGRDCPYRRLGCHDAAVCDEWGKYEAKMQAKAQADDARRKAKDDLGAVRAGAKKKLHYSRCVSLKKKIEVRET